MIKRISASVFVLLLSPSVVYAWSWDDLWPWGSDEGACKYTRAIDKMVDIGNTDLLRVVAGAGSLSIEGKDTNTVRIEANLCSSNKDVLDDLDVIYKIDGDEFLIRTEIPKDFGGWTKAQSKIDLNLYVPQGFPLDVQDSSGSAVVSGVAMLEMVDSSGSLEIDNIAGDVKVTDSSGSLEIERVKGDVTVTDSSGSIEVSDVEGSLTVLVDSSGSIEGRRIDKNMVVKVDSSGSIRARQVGGDFVVEQDGSGGIRYEDIGGTVDLPND